MNNFDFNNLRQSFTYDCESGVLTRTRTNKAANSMDVHGYVVVFLMEKFIKRIGSFGQSCMENFQKDTLTI